MKARAHGVTQLMLMSAGINVMYQDATVRMPLIIMMIIVSNDKMNVVIL